MRVIVVVGLAALGVLVPGRFENGVEVEVGSAVGGDSAARDGVMEPDRASGVLDSLVGGWEGSGSLMGRSAAYAMSWTAEEVPGIYALDFGNAFRADDGSETPVLRARALYRSSASGVVDGTWFDSRGVRVELTGSVTATRLRIEWSAPTESGVTVYDWVGDGTVAVVDSVQGADGAREFGRALYVRRAGAGR